MAKFIFKLEAVLRQRDLVEQQCQREMAVAQGELVLVQAELKRLDDVVKTAVNDLRQNQLVGVLNLSFLAAHRRFMMAMQKQGLLQLQRVDTAKEKVAGVRVKLAEAAKQKKIIEKLRERQHAAWLAEGARREMADLDEIAMQMSTANIREQWAGAHASATDAPEAGQ